MKNFIIMTDSCCDLPINIIEDKKISFVSLTCQLEGREYFDDLGKSLRPKDFFDSMRKGATPVTSQPSVQAFYEAFRVHVQSGHDIINICVSSGLSGTYNSANIARTMILDEYKDARIYTVDTLTASLGQGLMVLKALEMKDNGSSFEDIINYIENNRQSLNTYITVDDLSHLKRGGRISAAAAAIGIVLHIKPVLTINHEGKAIPLLKVKGRKNVLNKLAEIVAERIESPESQRIAICHGDVIEEAEKLKELILERVSLKEVLINYIGPVVGTHGGPGALAVFFVGKDRQQHVI